MARNRTISPDFWTWEAVIDCKPMTRLLFIGLWNFADDFGIQPLRPRTIRMQVFPGDDIGADEVRAMVDELAAQGLVRIYEVYGVAYVQIADWHQLQLVGKRARRRYPPIPAGVPGVVEPDEQPTPTMADHRIAESPRSPPPGEAGERPSPTMETHSSVVAAAPAVGEAGEQPSRAIESHGKGLQSPPRPGTENEPQRMREKVKDLLHGYWPRHAAIDSVDDETADRWTAKWIAEGRDYGRDIYPAVRDFYVMQPSYPPTNWQDLDARLRPTAAPA